MQANGGRAMTKLQSEAVANQAVCAAPTRDRGRAIGLGVLIVIVCFVAVWLYAHGRPAVSAPAAMRVAPKVESARFTGNEWNLPNDATLGFVAIPAGEFLMGSDPTVDSRAYENERWSEAVKQGTVELPEFYIGRHEVTVAQFAVFVAATNRPVDTQTLRGAGDHPVTNVTWTDAIAYARWLELQLRDSAQTPAALKQLLNDGWHLTLPSEAQWEKAARGSDGRIYPWGNVVDTAKANFGRSGTVDVGSVACSECAYGLTDMSGNVWEVTRSPLQPYPWTATDESREPTADALFVMRGGAFNDPPNNVRAAIRGGIDPGARRPFIGFRLVMEKR